VHPHAGIQTIDASIPRGVRGRLFTCHVLLLYWTGDYPAQAKVSGTHDKTCHWCTYDLSLCVRVGLAVSAWRSLSVSFDSTLTTLSFSRYKSEHAPEVNRRAWGDYRRYLPRNHALRKASGVYGPLEERDPPLVRTHDAFVEDGKRNEAHHHKILLKTPKVYKKDYPYKSTGIALYA
jgi:hypothetical protein